MNETGSHTSEAVWPLRVSPGTKKRRLRRRVKAVAARSQYGWGHTIDFGPFRAEGFLGTDYLRVVGTLDALGWLPASLEGMVVADVGCFTGGITALMAHRGAERVVAVDEVASHLEQCRVVVTAFGLEDRVDLIDRSLFSLPDVLPARSFDLVILSGVLYHLSDMLVGLYAMRALLKEGGTLLIESNAVHDDRHSYANFGRFSAGMWWQPTTLCVKDMCEMMGYRRVETHSYVPSRCLARAVRSEEGPPFRRGLNWPFDDISDAVHRTVDPRIMAPAPVPPESG